ncbi:putative recombinase [Oscillibacter valericigenes Sjm18-20]|nr:putative recombinase [Oscillibacter valericigenes Sjm18-20]
MYGTIIIDDRPTLIYCRESRDENSENYERIETQRDILTAFCKKRGLVNVVDIVMDDDTTGTNFRRFDAILERVRRREIQVLVFKDASRLGRNLKESLIFTDTIENYGAEIIFESEEYNEDFFPLKAWFNEQRAKEDSLKIRRVLKHKMETGTLLVKPFYGYRRSENGNMVPDEETAGIVRWIFDEVQKGRGSYEIATELNAKGIPTPSQAAGYSNCMSSWVSQHIRRIVTNPVYMGTMIHNRTTKKSYKNKKTVIHPEPEWIVLEHHHEPLVSQEEFEEVQETRKKFKRTKYNAVNRPFSGLLQCGRCGRPLVLRLRKNRPDAYICGKNHNEGAIKDEIRLNYGCNAHHVRESFLYSVTKRYLEQLLRTSDVDVQDIIRQVPQMNQVYHHSEELQKKLEQVKSTISKMYDDKLAGIISESLFVYKYSEYSAIEKSLTSQLAELESARKPTQKKRLTDLQLEDIINGLNEKTITKEQLRLVFDQIIVYEAGEIQQEDQDRLGLTQENYQLIKLKGGIVFLENATPSIGIMAP